MTYVPLLSFLLPLHPRPLYCCLLESFSLHLVSSWVPEVNCLPGKKKRAMGPVFFLLLDSGANSNGATVCRADRCQIATAPCLEGMEMQRERSCGESVIDHSHSCAHLMRHVSPQQHLLCSTEHTEVCTGFLL